MLLSTHKGIILSHHAPLNTQGHHPRPSAIMLLSTHKGIILSHHAPLNTQGHHPRPSCSSQHIKASSWGNLVPLNPQGHHLRPSCSSQHIKASSWGNLVPLNPQGHHPGLAHHRETNRWKIANCSIANQATDTHSSPASSAMCTRTSPCLTQRRRDHRQRRAQG